MITGPAALVEYPTAFPTGGDTQTTEQGDIKQCHLSAIAMLNVQYVLWHARDGAVIKRTCPRIVGTDPIINQGCLKYWIGFCTYNLLSQGLHLLVDKHVRKFLNGILLVYFALLVVRLQVLQDSCLMEDLCAHFVTEIHFKTGRLAFNGLLFHIHGMMKATRRMSGRRRRRKQLEVALSAIVKRIREPCLDGFTGRNSISRNFDIERSVHLLPVAGVVLFQLLYENVFAQRMYLGIFLLLALNDFSRIYFLVQKLEVADGLSEPTFFSINHSCFQILLLFPSFYLLVGSTGYFLQKQFFPFFTRQAEIISDARHHGLQRINQPSMFVLLFLTELADGLFYLGKFTFLHVGDGFGFPCLCM